MTSSAFSLLDSTDLSRWLVRVVAGALLVAVAGCSTRQPAPVEERTARPVQPAPALPPPPAPGSPPVAEPDWRPREYTVKRGDTLYKIALDHGLDYRDLAAWNGIENVNLIREGQVLRLAAPGEGGTSSAAGVTTSPLKTAPLPGDVRPAPSGPAIPLVVPGPRNADNYKAQPKAAKEPFSEQALREMQRAAAPAAAPPPEPAVVARAEPRPAPDVKPPVADAKPALAEDEDRMDWMWPAKGKIVTGFSDTANLKGIDIAGTSGQPVVAGAGGKVVYAGTGLRGYGKLIIIKHNATYLSAYAHNKDILVKEGQQVARGQKIAEMGNTDADQVKLHFEIRRLGKPMDPLRYLPPA